MPAESGSATLHYGDPGAVEAFVVKETSTVTSYCNLGGKSCQERNLPSHRSRGQQSTAREQQGFITSKGSQGGPRGSSVAEGVPGAG